MPVLVVCFLSKRTEENGMNKMAVSAKLEIFCAVDPRMEKVFF